MSDSTPAKPVRTRIAPSPTGIAHVGTLYIALFNYAFAKSHDGQFLVRIEDTDRNRFVAGAEDVIFEALDWAGIKPDESVQHGGDVGPYRQSERLELYQQYADQLIESGNAYYCFCSPERLQDMRQAQQRAQQPPKYDRHCWHTYTLDEAKQKIAAGEPHVVRMRVPEGVTQWQDRIRDTVQIDNAQVDDQVIVKSDGFPTYHLAVVVDDHLMGVTHVMRGEEWISSTPKHILLYSMLGWELPEFAHMPLLRNPDKSKLSKRKNDVSILSYKEKGYLPEALLNFLMLLGWSHPAGKEFPISLDEFVTSFSLDRMQKTGPVFDTDKLDWMNGKYLREVLSREEVLQRLQPYLPSDVPITKVSAMLELVLDRMRTLTEFEELTAFFYRPIDVDPALLTKKSDADSVRIQLQHTRTALEKLSEWNTEKIESVLRDLHQKFDWKKSQYFMMVRVTVTGRMATPPLFETMAVIDQDEVLRRFDAAMQLLAA